MSDLISRQAAIDALGEKPLAWLEGEYELGLQQQWEADVDAIKAVPSAQPKTGKWIVTYKFEDCYYAKCNKCKVTQVFYYNKALTNYCPNCGAKMDEVEDG